MSTFHIYVIIALLIFFNTLSACAKDREKQTTPVSYRTSESFGQYHDYPALIPVIAGDNYPANMQATDVLKSQNSTEKPVSGLHMEVNSDRLEQNIHFTLGMSNAFIKFRSGSNIVASSFISYDNMSSNAVTYEGSLGFGVKTRLFNKIAIQPDLTFFDYQVVRYSKTPDITTDIEYFNLRYWISGIIKLSLGISLTD